MEDMIILHCLALYTLLEDGLKSTFAPTVCTIFSDKTWPTRTLVRQ
jgi:hypothetical protein